MFKIISKKKYDDSRLMWGTLNQTLKAKDTEIAELTARCRALEDAHENGTGIKVRVDNNVVLAKFTKVEMCLLQGTIYEFARHAKTMDDTKFAMALYDKMTPMIAGMKEEKDGGSEPQKMPR